MKTLKIFLAVTLVVLMSSCSSYTYTSRSTNIKTTDLNATAMLVDVRPDFSRRIVTVSERQKTMELALAQAKYMAVVDNKCDVIVDPVYKAEKHGNRYVVSLTGFAGFYENPRTMYEDIDLLKKVSREDVEKFLILKDPTVLGLLNPASSNSSEVINIYGDNNSKCSCPKEQVKTVAPVPAPAAPVKKK